MAYFGPIYSGISNRTVVPKLFNVPKLPELDMIIFQNNPIPWASDISKGHPLFMGDTPKALVFSCKPIFLCVKVSK
jgi:hypothetical protein